MPVRPIQAKPPLLKFFFILDRHNIVLSFLSFSIFDDVFTKISVVKCFGAVLPYRAFFVVSREKIRPYKTLSANVLKNILKKVSKRFGNNVILYISLHR